MSPRTQGHGTQAGSPPASPSPSPAAARPARSTRNDDAILRAAHDVFLEDPKAPIAAVAARAGVGMSALYRRHASKEDLLRRLCHDGLRRFLAEADAADSDPD